MHFITRQVLSLVVLDQSDLLSRAATLLLRKSTLIGLGTGLFGLQLPVGQLMASVLLLVLSLALHAYVQPYGDSAANLLDGLALVGETAVACAILTRLSSSGVNRSELAVFEVLAVVFAAPFVVGWLFEVIDNLLMRRRMSTALWVRFRQLVFEQRARAGGPDVYASAHTKAAALLSAALAEASTNNAPFRDEGSQDDHTASSPVVAKGSVADAVSHDTLASFRDAPSRRALYPVSVEGDNDGGASTRTASSFSNAGDELSARGSEHALRRPGVVSRAI